MVNVTIPTGFSGAHYALISACSKILTTAGGRWWAAPDLRTEAGWYVGEHYASTMKFKTFPSRGAAEMWMLHHG